MNSNLNVYADTDGEESRAVRPGRRVLVAEDDREMNRLLTWALEDAGYVVDSVFDGDSLWRRVAPQLAGAEPSTHGLVVSDIRMPGLSGLEFLRRASTCDHAPAVILITSFGDREVHEEAAQLGALVLDKPFELDLLVDAASRLLPSEP